MNFIPVQYRLLALLAVIVAAFGFGWIKGALHGELKLERAQVRAERELTAMAAKRAKVTTVVETKYVDRIAKAQVITQTIVKEVDRYVPLAADCPVSPGFRVLHDAAATGVVPDPASLAHAAAATTREVAATVVDNYGACRESALRLEGLQEWIREQMKIMP